LHLKFSEKYIQNVRIQLNSNNQEDKLKLEDVNEKTNEINLLNDYHNIRNMG